MKDIVNEIKNMVERINGRLNGTEKQISELEDRAVEITDAEYKQINK